MGFELEAYRPRGVCDAPRGTRGPITGVKRTLGEATDAAGRS